MAHEFQGLADNAQLAATVSRDLERVIMLLDFTSSFRLSQTSHKTGSVSAAVVICDFLLVFGSPIRAIPPITSLAVPTEGIAASLPLLVR
jgi:hypothetical protein